MALKLSTHAVKILGAKPPAATELPGDIGANFHHSFKSDPDGITRRLMDSKILGAVVPIAWTPDGSTVWVEGIPYTASEIRELMARHPNAATIRAVHEMKRTFEGTIHGNHRR
jgi:hypothetical protein